MKFVLHYVKLVISIKKIHCSLFLRVQLTIFSAANLALAGIPLTNALGESMPSRH